jgi:hypothetical protein
MADSSIKKSSPLLIAAAWIIVIIQKRSKNLCDVYSYAYTTCQINLGVVSQCTSDATRMLL